MRAFLIACVITAVLAVPPQASAQSGFSITVVGPNGAVAVNWYDYHYAWEQRGCYPHPDHGRWSRYHQWDGWCGGHPWFASPMPDDSWRHGHAWDHGRRGDREARRYGRYAACD